MADPVRVGLIGYGMAGQVFHAPVINSIGDMRLASIVQRHGDDARLAYPTTKLARDASEVIEDPTIDLVVIATPNASHFAFAREALLAGKHVVIDKPFTPTSAEADRLIELAQQKERIVTAFQNRRWDGDFQTVKALIEARLVGRLVEFESHFDRFRNYIREAWREEPNPGSGLTFDLGSHLVDQALVLFGQPRSVTADIRIQRKNAKVDDSFELILDYEQVKVTLKAGVLVRERAPRFILHGTRGSFVKYGLDPQEEALKAGCVPGIGMWGQEPRELWGDLLTTINGLHFDGKIETMPGNYQLFYTNIVEAIRGQAELAVKPEEVRNTISIIELAFQSVAEKRTIPVPDH